MLTVFRVWLAHQLLRGLDGWAVLSLDEFDAKVAGVVEAMDAVQRNADAMRALVASLTDEDDARPTRRVLH